MYQSINQSINQSSQTFKGKNISNLINRLRCGNKAYRVMESLNGLDYAAKTSDFAQIQATVMRETIGGNFNFVKGVKEYLYNNASKYAYDSKPQTLGEGLRRVVNAVSEGAGLAKPTTCAQKPGLRVYDNGVKVCSRDDGFYVNARRKKGHLPRNFFLMKNSMKKNCIIARFRVNKSEQEEVVSDMFAQPWKVVQRFFKKDGISKKMYDKKIVDLPNGNRKYFEFVSQNYVSKA